MCDWVISFIPRRTIRRNVSAHLVMVCLTQQDTASSGLEPWQLTQCQVSSLACTCFLVACIKYGRGAAEGKESCPSHLSEPFLFPVMFSQDQKGHFCMLGVPELFFSHQVLKQVGVQCMVAGIGILLLSPLPLGPSVLISNTNTLSAKRPTHRMGRSEVKGNKERAEVPEGGDQRPSVTQA